MGYMDSSPWTQIKLTNKSEERIWIQHGLCGFVALNTNPTNKNEAFNMGSTWVIWIRCHGHESN